MHRANRRFLYPFTLLIFIGRFRSPGIVAGIDDRHAGQARSSFSP